MSSPPRLVIDLPGSALLSVAALIETRTFSMGEHGASTRSRGASEAGGTAIGILPGDRIGEANPHCTHVVATGIGHARNLAVVSSGEVVIAIGGEWGTLSEIGFARAIGRPVVALRSWELRGREAMAGAPGVIPAESAAVAVEQALAALP